MSFRVGAAGHTATRRYWHLERMNVAVTVHPTLKPEMTDEEIINATGGRWR
jgi:hypothetical protein